MSTYRERDMHIAVVGGFGVGLSMRVPEFPVPGETVTGSEFVEGHGGKGSNQAVGAARLGAEVSILTALGDDARARMAEELWDREGVRYDHVARAPSPTMVGFI